jgi:hypothetical protein
VTAVKVWQSGAWVESSTPDKVWAGGAWVAFAPAGGTDEVLAWAAEPSNTDADDGSQAYNMGVLFTLVASKNCIGVQWRVPDTTPSPPGGTHAVSIWDDVGASRIAYKEFTPVPGGYQRILFDSPVALTLATAYVAAVYTNHYSFRSGTPAGTTSPSGNIVAGAGRLAAYNSGAASAPQPTDSFTSIYYVSPIVEV